MLRKILWRYTSLFSSIASFLLLLLSCVLLAGAVVLPLWRFATLSPHLYTVTVTSIIFLIFLFFLVKKIKKNGAKSFLIFLAKFFLIAVGLFFFVTLVLRGLRLHAFLELIAFVFFYGFISFLISPSKKAELKSENEI